MSLRLGINRWDWRSPNHFVQSVVAAETHGVDICFQPVNPLGVMDPYVLFALAAQQTSSIHFGTLLETPQLRPAAVAAGSTATIEAVAPGRTMLVYGVGDTAVRWINRRPSRMAELEEATVQARAYLRGDRLDVGARAPAWLRHGDHTNPPPVWIAASGPKTLRMAGRVADGVFLRCGTHPANIAHAVAQIDAGIAEAGRSIDEVDVGLIVHTCLSQHPAEIRAITRAMAAGFYEYAPALFDPPEFEWNGPPVHELQEQVWPDFHHARDLVGAGQVVDFLPDEIAGSFSFFGTADDVVGQINRILDAVPRISIVVPHPVPMPNWDDLGDYARWVGAELKPRLPV
ncbi:MAG: LLM class flavin-dependent oxidoreductase [Actinomycetota bacterium]